MSVSTDMNYFSTVLGVPVKVRDEIYGNLYLTDKIGWSEFTKDDVALVEALALAAGVAIENTRLHQQVQVAAVYEDRDRLVPARIGKVPSHQGGCALK